jgi:hypothetical protein
MSIAIFLGPTLPVATARGIVEATYLPPVARGEVAALLLQPEPPRAIGLIDGVCAPGPAVWHKEVLFALSQGVRVFGSAGIGALRAAELHTFGMEGVGRIFAAYRDGVWEDDEEIAVIYGAAASGYPQFSEPMVNIREGLARAETEGHIRPDTHQCLVTAAKQMFYPERSWPSVLACGFALSLPAAELAGLQAFVRQTAPNLQRDDALALLRHLATLWEDGLTPPPTAVYF